MRLLSIGIVDPLKRYGYFKGWDVDCIEVTKVSGVNGPYDAAVAFLNELRFTEILPALASIGKALGNTGFLLWHSSDIKLLLSDLNTSDKQHTAAWAAIYGLGSTGHGETLYHCGFTRGTMKGFIEKSPFKFFKTMSGEKSIYTLACKEGMSKTEAEGLIKNLFPNS